MKVFKELYKELKLRDKKGWASYGRAMETFDGRNTLQDLKEELLDALVYIKKLELENEIKKSTSKKRSEHLREVSKKSGIHRQTNKRSKKTSGEGIVLKNKTLIRRKLWKT